MRNTVITLLLVLAAAIGAHAGQIQRENMANETMNPGDVKVLLHTSLGDITLLLYGDTPRHRDNFIKRVEAGDYDGVLFHRVISDFMIQTGDPQSKNAPKGKMLGAGDAGTEIEAEFLFPKHYHHRGAIAAARQGDAVNPEKKSSGSQFYIVTGKKFSQQKPGAKKKSFCSDRCRYIWWNHSRNKRPYRLVCQHCGRDFISFGNQNRKFCGRECYLLSRYGEGLP